MPAYLMGLVSRRVRELQEAGEQALKEYMDVVAHEMGKRTGTPYAPDAQPMGLQRRSGRTHASVTTCTMKDIRGGTETKFMLPGYLKAQE